MLFDLAEFKASEKTSMFMQDWLSELDKLARMYGKGVLGNAGTISRSQAEKKAKKEIRTYEAKTLSPVEKEYLDNMKAIEKIVDKESRKK